MRQWAEAMLVVGVGIVAAGLVLGVSERVRAAERMSGYAHTAALQQEVHSRGAGEEVRVTDVDAPRPSGNVGP